MIARAVNAAADVIHRAQVNGAVTAAGLAVALDSARLLVSPEEAARTAAVEAERDALKARVAELEAERHSTNEALDDAVQELRRRREDVTPQVTKLRALLAGQRDAVEGEHYPAVHHAYRVPRDLPPLGGQL